MQLETIARKAFPKCEVTRSEPHEIELKHRGFVISHQHGVTDIHSVHPDGYVNTKITITNTGRTSVDTQSGEAHPRTVTQMALLAHRAYKAFVENRRL